MIENFVPQANVHLEVDKAIHVDQLPGLAFFLRPIVALDANRQLGFLVEVYQAPRTGDQAACLPAIDRLHADATALVIVEFADAKPEPSADARWKKDRDEQGFVTWAVNVARTAETQITWRVKLSFPEGSQISR